MNDKMIEKIICDFGKWITAKKNTKDWMKMFQLFAEVSKKNTQHIYS